jgi:hypothetical protein
LSIWRISASRSYLKVSFSLHRLVLPLRPLSSARPYATLISQPAQASSQSTAC